VVALSQPEEQSGKVSLAGTLGLLVHTACSRRRVGDIDLCVDQPVKGSVQSARMAVHTYIHTGCPYLYTCPYAYST